MPPALQGRAQKAERHKGSRFRPLSGMLDEDVLQPCWRDLRKEAASGVDQGYAQASAQHLDERIHRRVARLTPQGYRATRGGWDHARAGRISAGNESVESDLSQRRQEEDNTSDPRAQAASRRQRDTTHISDERIVWTDDGGAGVLTGRKGAHAARS